MFIIVGLTLHYLWLKDNKFLYPPVVECSAIIELMRLYAPLSCCNHHTPYFAPAAEKVDDAELWTTMRDDLGAQIADGTVADIPD